MIFDAATIEILNQGCPMLNRSRAGKKLAQLESLISIGMGGTSFYLDGVNGLDTNDGLTPLTAVKTLAVGYGLLTANKNDTLYFIAGASSVTIPSGFTWAKSYSHFKGISAMLVHGGRSRLSHAADFTPIFPITANGCQFSNIHIQHGRGNAANLVNVYLTGSRNSFYNVHLEGPLHTAEGAAAYRQLVFGTSAEANTFISCSIGAWSTQQTGVTGREIEFLGNASDTVFINCTIRCHNDTVGHEMVEAGAGVGDASILVEFDNCKFIQHDNTAILTKVFEHPANGYILLSECIAVRSAAFSSDATRVLLADSIIV